MVRDLKLADEIPLLRPAGVNRRFSFDPITDAPATVTLKSGVRVTAKPTTQTVRNGKLIQNSELEVSGQ
jgi:hypothetical protein